MLKLKVVTLNTWGLWLLSKRREERMRALAAWLRAGAEEADVVTLQEVRTSQGWGGRWGGRSAALEKSCCSCASA